MSGVNTPKMQRGSRARCIALAEGSKRVVAQRLTELVTSNTSPALPIQVDEWHWWQPRGCVDISEAKLGESLIFLSDEQREIVMDWWLSVRHPLANTPNWDIVSQATIEGRQGLILVEAKAHKSELSEGGKRSKETDSDNSKANHEQIGRAIIIANEGLNSIVSGWNLSRDSHYQLANRFAWSWKLASLGIPIVLVYLGFLDATDMSDCGQLFADHQEWKKAVLAYSTNIVPRHAWEQTTFVNGTPLCALIKSAHCDLPPAHCY